MKTIMLMNRLAVCAAVLTTATQLRAFADQTATVAGTDKSYTGIVLLVDPQEHVLKAKGFVFTKTFNLGDGCAYALLDNSTGTISDLRPGEKIKVTYQNAHGVLVADRIEQQPMRFEGMVQAVNPDAHTLIVRAHGMDKTFQIANGCAVELREKKAGALADIQTGNHVTVTYEKPNGNPTAREIAQTSMEFTGTLTAIDLGEKTLKAKAAFASKKFNVADNCAIVINGKPDGQLSDLKPDDKLVFSYNDINGVNVVNRIAPAETEPGSVATTTAPMTGN